MATVTGYTAARTQAIEDSNIISGAIDGSGHLILEAHDGSTIDAGYMLASVPDATTTHTGVVELATNAEAIAGTDTVRAITPAAAKAIIDALILNGLADVTISSPATGQVLRYNGTQWVNVTDLVLVGEITATKGRFGGSAGDAVFIGDDAVLQDVNLADTIGIKGQQTPANGRLVFGSGCDTNLYRASADRLKTDDAFECGSDIYLGGLSLGHGHKMSASGFGGSGSTSGSTAAGAESALNTSAAVGSNSMAWVNGYIYMIVINYQLSDNTNSSYSMTIPRLYTSGGTVIAGWVHYNGFNGHLGLSYTQIVHVKRVAGSNLTAGLGFTVQRYISGVAGSSFLDGATVNVYNVGLVSDHSSLAATAGAI